jgi:hypothetical protein
MLRPFSAITSTFVLPLLENSLAGAIRHGTAAARRRFPSASVPVLGRPPCFRKKSLRWASDFLTTPGLGYDICGYGPGVSKGTFGCVPADRSG